jgi:hypothetical protein
MTADPYNYDTFRRYMIPRDLHFHGGPQPGQGAPDFDLPTVDGGRFRLSEQRGQQPVLLEFVSITCPIVLGARPGMRRLHRDLGEPVQFVSLYVREAHPGERYPALQSDEQKRRHARDWAEQDRIPWTVAVDTLQGSMHRAYGWLPNAIYLIDRTGYVAFRAVSMAQEGLLRRKIEDLLRSETAGKVMVNLGQRENLLIPFLHGAAEAEKALTRGGKKAVEDFRREMGPVGYGLAKVAGAVQPLLHPGNNAPGRQTVLKGTTDMATADAAERFRALSTKEPLGEYNYAHFRTKHLLQDARRTIQKRGVLPGQMAPDFELPRADGGTLRLSALRGKPVLVHFGSFT